jgi:hypothetical protein
LEQSRHEADEACEQKGCENAESCRRHESPVTEDLTWSRQAGARFMPRRRPATKASSPASAAVERV